MMVTSVLVAGLVLGQRFPAALERGHSHNDYYRARPLIEALEAGLCSIEADIFLVDGELRVGHDRSELRPGRTLSSLYLEPLAALARENGGRVYPGWPEVTLLVDIKAEGEKVFPYLLHELQKFGDVVGRREEGAFRVVVSGAVPRRLILQDSEMWMAVDGRPGDLGQGFSPRQMPLVSEGWFGAFRKTSVEAMTAEDVARAQGWVEATHREGKRFRFWALSDNEKGWEWAFGIGVDLINTDKPDALRAFLTNQASR